MARLDAYKSKADRSRLGAHYTPHNLARKVSRHALEPLMAYPHAMRCAQCSPSLSLLDIQVIDPACGDGGFLLAAADVLGELLYQAYQLEGIQCVEDEAVDRVIAHCLVGVDIDPEAVEQAQRNLPGADITCADALLDWRFDTDGRPTAFLGNPPFLGGRKISSRMGKPYQERLLKEYPRSNGGADLCAYFLLLAAQMLDDGKSKGTMSFICTNTIAQGDTRKAGLRFLLQEHRDTIYRADTNIHWPGAANVTVSIVHLANEELWSGIGGNVEDQ